jgi:peroxiredoxin Q/BCP
MEPSVDVVFPRHGNPEDASMPMPKEGDRAPALRLAAPDGTTVDLAAMKGKPVVVFFYPRAATPG